ncbi:MAG: hypothetical protein AMJ84_13360 [Acidithiobacillales bacterium SM23_46]|nr:MAG: hypothetical protein AMJ84_13360 [Acidithiobacillales bacterium SM23_46]
MKGLQAKLEQVRDAQQAKPAPLAPTAQPAPDDAVIQRLRNSIGLAGMKLPVETRNRIFANNAMTTWNSIHQMGLQALRDLNQEVQDALATPD